MLVVQKEFGELRRIESDSRKLKWILDRKFIPVKPESALRENRFVRGKKKKIGRKIYTELIVVREEMRTRALSLFLFRMSRAI